VTRRLRCFAFPSELIAMLAEVSERLDLVATVYQWPLSRTSPVTGKLQQLPIDWEYSPMGQMRIMIHPPQADSAPPWGELSTAVLGWIDVSLGRCYETPEGVFLELSDIGAKYDYYEDGFVKHNLELPKLFRRLATPLKKQLHRPMLLENIVYGGKGPVDTEYYTDAAAAFHAGGGQLWQWGVKNQRFHPLLMCG